MSTGDAQIAENGEHSSSQADDDPETINMDQLLSLLRSTKEDERKYGIELLEDDLKTESPAEDIIGYLADMPRKRLRHEIVEAIFECAGADNEYAGSRHRALWFLRYLVADPNRCPSSWINVEWFERALDAMLPEEHCDPIFQFMIAKEYALALKGLLDELKSRSISIPDRIYRKREKNLNQKTSGLI
jgi:hypothetical protein